ncbi:hypothetical protein SASPL_143698 [Salvia splendens]|uniref:Uncharacterized protein n=1 Tax=Salvia splendens TaxID=180675 RepID=A0A8X8ZB32_SALSN|nr:hypothetical protein SASPL_143698 [Salvia splendens]
MALSRSGGIGDNLEQVQFDPGDDLEQSDRLPMSARRLAKGKAVDDGESSGKRKSVVGVPAQAKRPHLMLPNDVELVVDTKDIKLVFGFPNGGIKIDRCDLNTGFKYLETIPLEEEVDVHAMQTKMETALIETSPCGYVRPRIVDILGNLQKIRKHDWCSAKMSKGVEHSTATEDVVENRDGSEEFVYIRGVWGAVKQIGDGFNLLAKELNQAPPEIRKMDNFRITYDTLMRAFRLDDNDVDPVESMTQTQSAQSSSAEDWSALKFLLDAADEIDILENGDACHRDSERREETDMLDNPTNSEEEGEREPAAELGGGCLDFMTGSDIGREPVSAAKAGTVVNKENALDVARAISRDVEVEHNEVDIAICSAVDAVYVLGDAAFETQIVTRGVDKGKFPVRGDAESHREENTFPDIQPAPVKKMRLPTEIREGSMSTRISPLWTREERDCYQFLLATPYMWTDYVVYDDDMVELSKRKFSTLKPHEAVDVGVVDAWAWYLNRMEEEKLTQNPTRLFATTSPTTFNVVERRTSWVQSEAAHSFCEEMDGQFNMDGNLDFTKYDLTGVADVLDIVVPENGIPDATKYARDLGLLWGCKWHVEQGSQQRAMQSACQEEKQDEMS